MHTHNTLSHTHTDTQTIDIIAHGAIIYSVSYNIYAQTHTHTHTHNTHTQLSHICTHTHTHTHIHMHIHSHTHTHTQRSVHIIPEHSSDHKQRKPDNLSAAHYHCTPVVHNCSCRCSHGAGCVEWRSRQDHHHYHCYGNHSNRREDGEIHHAEEQDLGCPLLALLEGGVGLLPSNLAAAILSCRAFSEFSEVLSLHCCTDT